MTSRMSSPSPFWHSKAAVTSFVNDIPKMYTEQLKLELGGGGEAGYTCNVKSSRLTWPRTEAMELDFEPIFPSSNLVKMCDGKEEWVT